MAGSSAMRRGTADNVDSGGICSNTVLVPEGLDGAGRLPGPGVEDGRGGGKMEWRSVRVCRDKRFFFQADQAFGG